MQHINCSSPIKDTLLKSKEGDKYLLLSLTLNNQILWIVKVQGKEKEFWDLIQLTIPYGITIKGLAINNVKDTVINGLYLVNKKNELDRKELIRNCFWIISFTVANNELLLNDNSTEIDLDNFINANTQRSLKSHMLLFNDEPIQFFKENYVEVFSTFKKEIGDEGQLNNYTDNNGDRDRDEDREEKHQMIIDDNMDIVIQQIGIKINNQGLYKPDWKVIQKKYSNYIKDNHERIEVNYLQSNTKTNNDYNNKKSHLISSGVMKLNQNIKKQFAISINALVPKDLCIKDLLSIYKDHTQYILNKMHSININQESIVSSYIISIDTISLPFCLVYSIPESIKQFTNTLNKQSNYYKEILSLNDNTIIAYSYLVNHLDYHSLTKDSFTDCFINIHQHIDANDNNPNKCIIIGDYLTSLCHFDDQSYGTGYRAIQTVISWLWFNNMDQYPNLTIPTIQDIKQALFVLEEITPNDIDKPYDISISQLSQVLSLLVDIHCETTSLSTNQLPLFKQDLESMYYELKKHKQPSPIILSLSKNTYYTIVGYDKSEGNILVICHEYIGKLTLVNALRMKTIQWVNIEKFFNTTKRFDYLILTMLI